MTQAIFDAHGVSLLSIMDDEEGNSAGHESGCFVSTDKTRPTQGEIYRVLSSFRILTNFSLEISEIRERVLSLKSIVSFNFTLMTR